MLEGYTVRIPKKLLGKVRVASLLQGYTVRNPRSIEKVCIKSLYQNGLTQNKK